MPDPILPGFRRAQVVFKGLSGLAEDVYVNSFCFRDDTVFDNDQEVADHIANRLHEFYATPVAPSSSAIKSLLSAQQISPQYDIKVYDLGDAPPRLPIIVPKDLGTGMAASSFPAEVSIACSFYANRSLPRRRGRVYLGPLGVNALTVAQGNVMVTEAARKIIADAAARMRTAATQSARWCVLSGVDQNAFVVTGGWVDNAFDTQRRRGASPTTRTLWGDPPTSAP